MFVNTLPTFLPEVIPALNAVEVAIRCHLSLTEARAGLHVLQWLEAGGQPNDLIPYSYDRWLWFPQDGRGCMIRAWQHLLSQGGTPHFVPVFIDLHCAELIGSDRDDPGNPAHTARLLRHFLATGTIRTTVHPAQPAPQSGESR